MPHVIAYYRYSSLEQSKGHSIERQRGMAEKFVAAHGWTIAEELIDEGKSAFIGANLLSGKLGEFDANATAGLYPDETVLLCERFDRLSRRNALDATNWLARICKLGIRVATAADGKVYDGLSDFNDLLIALVGFHLANQESKIKSKRVGDAFEKKRKLAREGVILTRLVPLWLTVEEGKMIEVPDRVALVRTIFQWAADGHGHRAIASRLNREGIQPFSKATAWHASSIRNILINRAVIGDYQPMSRIGSDDRKRRPVGDVIRNYFPQIIDPDVFATVNDPERLEARRGMGIKKEQIANVLAGLARCLCDAPMRFSSSVKRGTVLRRRKADGTWRTFTRHTPESYLLCSASEVGNCQHKRKHRYERVVAAILDTVLHLALDDEAFAKRDDTAELLKEIGRMKRAVELEEEAANKALDVAMKVAGTVGEAFAMDRYQKSVETLEVYRQRLTALEQALTLAQGRVTAEEHVRRVGEVRQLMDSDDPEERFKARHKVMQALRRIVDQVAFNFDDGTSLMLLKDSVRLYQFDANHKLRAMMPMDKIAEAMGETPMSGNVVKTIQKREGDRAPSVVVDGDEIQIRFRR